LLTKQKILKEKEIFLVEEYEQACKTFNQKFNFLFKSSIGHVVVLSGLRTKSMGNGVYKNTVFHILMDEDFTRMEDLIDGGPEIGGMR
jgi:hypothetical protein